jgi:methyl coenzyme M reductase alpha subunit
MSTPNTTIHLSISDEKLNYIKAFLKALKIKFEITKEEPYNQEFVKKMKQSDRIYESTSLTQEQKKAIDMGLKSLDDENKIPHDQVMNETKNRYPNLFK